MTVAAGYHCAAEGYPYPAINTEGAFYRSVRIRDEFWRYTRLFRDVGWVGRVVLVFMFPVAVAMWVVADELWKVRDAQLE